ncbi:MAG: hypothetical protein AAF078_11210 [Planctomycetota bacterium]
MTGDWIQQINLGSFMVSLAAIAGGVLLGLVTVWGGLWGVVTQQLFLSVGIVFTGAVLTNMAIACYRKPGGA